MKLYQFRLIDSEGNVKSIHPLQLPTEAAAIKVAHHLLASSGDNCALEIWHGNHAVQRIN